jgi:hypothetical protein
MVNRQRSRNIATRSGGVGGFEGFGDGCDAGGDVGGDGCGAAGGVEGVGVGPDQAEAFADGGVAEIFECDAKAGAVGELVVVAALGGEIGADFDGVADVAGEDEGGPGVVGREEAGVAFGLDAGAFHHDVPAAGGGAVTGLFGFENEAAALVEVDAFEVVIIAADGAFVDVVVMGGGGVGGVGFGDADDGAEIIEKGLAVGAFLAAFAAVPAGDEGFGGGVGGGVVGHRGGLWGRWWRWAMGRGLGVWVVGIQGYPPYG